jgi:hypothetical protein
LLIHDHPVWHWDFMLESEGVLRTWRLDADPVNSARIAATPLPDHRLAYLDYEGPVSNQRGQVQRIDRGEYETLNESTERLEVLLRGELLQGRVMVSIDSDGNVWFEHHSVEESTRR